MASAPIDGERKALVRAVSGGLMFVGLLRRSEWESRPRKAGELLVTQRALVGAALHIESLNGQFPIAGQTVIPRALLTGRSGVQHTGAAMDALLYSYRVQATEGREAIKALKAIKAQIS